MSDENVEKLRAVYDAFNRGDFDGVLQYLDPDVELHPGVIVPDSREQYRGRQGL
jgi:ketosteroid isomerase-like protein